MCVPTEKALFEALEGHIAEMAGLGTTFGSHASRLTLTPDPTPNAEWAASLQILIDYGAF